MRLRPWPIARSFPCAPPWIVAASALVPSPFYVTDILASVVGPAIALALLAAALRAIERRWTSLGVAIGSVFALAAIQASAPARAARFTPQPDPPFVSSPLSTTNLRLLVVNSRASSTRAHEALAVILREDADIVALVEPSSELLDALRASDDVRARWPSTSIPDRARGGFVVALLPAHATPLDTRAVEITYDDLAVRVLLAHPRSPRTPAAWRAGNAEVRAITALVRDQRPTIVLGDLNSTPTGWRGRAMPEAGLRACKPRWARAGTWPSRMIWPLRIAIDDAWVTDHFEVVSWRTRAIPGSDHHAVRVELARSKSTKVVTVRR